MSKTNWRFDMENAPRGSRVVSGKRSKFYPDYVQLSILDFGVPKFVFTYRTEGTKQNPDGYWAGCTNDQAYAWAAAPAPADVPKNHIANVAPVAAAQIEDDGEW